jgi:diguanylate cyclase (GGDEF)-like protein
MYRRLLFLLLAPTLAIMLLVGLAARSERAEVADANAVAELAELAAQAAAVDTALGAETIAAADVAEGAFSSVAFEHTNARLADLRDHIASSDTSSGHIEAAVAFIEETLRHRSDVAAGVVSPLQIADRYATARAALRNAIAVEALVTSPERRTSDVTALLALVNARSAHIDERLGVALAIRYQTWAPGQHGAVVGALERQQVYLEEVRAIAPSLVPVANDSLTEVRQLLLTSSDLPHVEMAEWTRLNIGWSAALTTAVETHAERVSVEARAASDSAGRGFMLTLIAAALVALLAVGSALYLSLRLARRIEHISDAAHRLAANPSRTIELNDRRTDDLGQLARAFEAMSAQVRHASERQRFEAAALQAIVHQRPLSEILVTCSELIAPRGSFELAGDSAVFVDAERHAHPLDHPVVGRDPELRLAADLVLMAQRRNRDQADLERRANYDSLTGLPNRAHAIRVLERACKTPTKLRPGILFLDLDGFKSVNDEYGHDHGDSLLRSVAEQLIAHVPAPGVVGRLGGDEFIVVFPAIASAADLDQRARQLRAAIAAVSVPRGSTIDVSVGAALLRDGQDHHQLLSEADAAMYAAKGSPARIMISSEELRLQQRATKDRERHLMHTLIDGVIEAHFQPIWGTRRTNIVAFEALARPVDGFGLGGPERFFADADRLGLAHAFDQRMLRRVLDQVAQWKAQGIATVPVAVNLSAQSLSRATLVDDIEQLLAITGTESHDLILEVTEDAIIPDLEATAARLGRLRQLGVGIAIDDFGTGYSSLAYLARLPFDILKIDRQLVSSIDTDHTNRSIVETVIRLADVLDVTVIAEGVEREAERAELERISCTMIQGFLLARPEPAERAAKRLLAETTSPAPTGRAELATT